jgi:hypothetical protein
MKKAHIHIEPSGARAHENGEQEKHTASRVRSFNAPASSRLRVFALKAFYIVKTEGPETVNTRIL